MTNLSKGKNIVLLGPPGCGKGTQSAFLADRFGFYKLSTGDLIRAEIATGTDRGMNIKDIVESGRFPSDNVILDLIREKVDQLIAQGQGIVFDGVPRTLNQAHALDEMLKLNGTSIMAVIEMKVVDKVLIDRIISRYICASCGEGYNDVTQRPQVEGVCDKCGSTEFKRRSDDTREVFENRLSVHRNQTEPLIPYYEAKGILTQIDGLLPREEVSHTLETFLLKEFNDCKNNF